MSTYVPIQAITLSSTVSSVTFSGIPQTYTDLVLVFAGAGSSAFADCAIRFNEDTGSNYSDTLIYGSGSTNGSGRHSNQTFPRGWYASSTQGINIWNIMSYSNNTTNKTFIGRSNTPNNEVEFAAGLWRNTSAVTSVTCFVDGTTFTSGSTFTLYGVGTGSPKAFGGTTVTTDGTYWYHTFQSSGVFEPLQNLSSVDYVVVAGGGGAAAGGSGAGGFKTSIGGSTLSLSANTKYSVTIGAGGVGASNSYGGAGTGQTQGSNSVFSSVTATGGGRGGGSFTGEGSTSPSAQLSGGSGGGASYSSGQATYGAGTTGEGNDGGADNYNNPPYAAAGGGGANAAGQANQSDSVAGAGGAGKYNTITNAAKMGELSGGNYYLAGGGGGGVYGLAGSGTGGAGGLGGGGNGCNGSSGTDAGQNGDPNTGGGAGGSSANAAGRSGGSGIVIVRYAV
jgi:hypothetical protein